MHIGGSGGVIALDRKGNIATAFTGTGMYIAHRSGDRPIVVKIYAERWT